MTDYFACKLFSKNYSSKMCVFKFLSVSRNIQNKVFPFWLLTRWIIFKNKNWFQNIFIGLLMFSLTVTHRNLESTFKCSCLLIDTDHIKTWEWSQLPIELVHICFEKTITHVEPKKKIRDSQKLICIYILLNR